MTPPASAPAMIRISTGERVAQYIARQIFEGVLQPGTRVPQDEIASTLGVSRIPVREALIALEREGWVRNELHRGAFICSLSQTSVRDHYDLFGMLYGFAATRAIDRSDHVALGARLTRIAAALKTNDVPAFSKAAVSFHRTVIEGARSPRLVTVMRSLSSLVPGEFFEMVPKARRIERATLPKVAAAITAGEADAAVEAYASTMSQVGREVVALFNSRGLFDTTGAG